MLSSLLKLILSFVDHSDSKRFTFRSPAAIFSIALIGLAVFCVSLCPQNALADETATSSSHIPLIWNPPIDPASEYDFEATLEFCHGSSGVYGYLAEGSSLPCGSLAPLIRMVAGKRYQLRLKNTAPANDADSITNLHTHGLHISGDGNADDVTRSVSGGNCLLYNYNIPASHMPGTYWYHAHKHGKTNLHVSGGAFGMLIIDADPQAPSAVPSPVNQWLANERLLLLSTLGNSRLANGKASETVEMLVDEWHYLRIAVADPKATTRVLKLVDANACEVRVAAYDGVWRSEVPHPQDMTTHELTGSSRLDVAIRCSSNNQLQYDGNSPSARIVDIVVHTNGIVSTASPYEDEQNGTPWVPIRPAYLADLRGEAMATTYSISMTAAQINGQSWNPDVPVATFEYGSIQQWQVSTTNAHPLHVHLYHMQVVSPGGCGNRYEEGEYYDTIASEISSCLVRFKMADIGGRMVLHCHILDHEDNGAMVWVDVANAPEASFSDIEELQGCADNNGGGSNCGDCINDFECGSTQGTDSCGNTCTSNQAGTCSALQTCSMSTFTCVDDFTTTAPPPPSCLASGVICSVDSECCSNRCNSNSGKCQR